MTKGFFITFEGGEGVGKTTQIDHLQQSLTENGHDVLITREPGGTPPAEAIREFLSHKNHGEQWSPEAECLLLFAARAMHIKNTIEPALNEGKIILCDRYIDSTRVYQGHVQKLDMDFILSLEERVVGDFVPDLTFVFDLEAEQAIERVNARGAQDHYDRGDLAFYEALREGFLKIVQENSARCVTVDASHGEEEIAASILKTALERLS